ncbi:hypothetical protein IWZ00DRAFT_533924 [Phyllosticta capitalensis]
MNEPGGVHRDNMKHLWETGTFSDLAVRALDRKGDERIYKVHKVVLCGKSEFFFNMFCRVKWKEATESMVDLMEDYQGVVEAMLEFMYVESYNHWPELSHIDYDDHLLYHARIHAAAIKYGIKGLPELSNTFIGCVINGQPKAEQLEALYCLLPFIEEEIPEAADSGVGKTLQRLVVESLGDFLDDEDYHQLHAEHSSFFLGVLASFREDQNPSGVVDSKDQEWNKPSTWTSAWTASDDPNNLW